MTAAPLHDAALELVRRSRTAQGLPGHVTDPVILARVAALLAGPAAPSGDARTGRRLAPASGLAPLVALAYSSTA